MLLPMTLLATLLLLGCGQGSEPPAQRPAEVASALARGALAFGISPASVEAVLGPPVASEDRAGFDWRTYRHAGRMVGVGFYNDMLGRVRVEGPMAWDEARGWAEALLPGFDPARLLKDDAGAWHYFETIDVRRLPFEAGLTFRREGESVVAIEGEMNWLD